MIEDILLRATFDAVVSELQRVNRAVEELERVGALVHQVYFREHANCTLTFRVNFFGDLERVRVGQIDIGW